MTCDLCDRPLEQLADESASRHDPDLLQKRIAALQGLLEEARSGSLTEADLQRLCPECASALQGATPEQAIMQRIAALAAWRAAEHI
ncbi:MAG TPA: hypothetical protein VFB58_13255 [Chloroflexota bacterium]|nr:hypothetical protein [Chloroflexota bacterium]